MPTYKSENHLRSISMDAGGYQDFDNVASVGAGVANTTVQARLVIPQRCKIFKVAVNFSAIGTGGAHKFNIVVGTGAEGSVGVVDTVSPAGTVVFSSDLALSGSADVPTVFNVDNTNGGVFDALYETGSLLTLRCVTPATTGSLTNLKVALFLKPVNAHAEATMIPTPDGNYGFDPSVL